MLRRRRKRLTRKSPHFLTEFPGWSINSPPRKRLTIPRSRRSNYGSIDCFNLRGAGGCIIRSIFLNDIAAAFEATDKPKHLLLAPYFKEEMKTLLPGWKSLVAESMKEELPVPAFSSALNYFYSLTSADLPANLVQAQRDYFGAHTFERKDELRGQFFHENWTGHGGDTKSGTYNV